MPRRIMSRSIPIVVACTICLTASVYAGDIKVMTSGAFTAPYLQLSPQFERDTKEKIVTLTTTMGVGVDSIPNRIARGEAVDVIIVAAATLDEMIRDGRVVAGSKVDLARSDIGMAVRAGAPKPDISSLEAFKRTLLQAKSIAYSASVSGDYLVTELVQRLGIADQVLVKSRRVVGERVGAVVARGEAEIGFQQISELLPVPGIDYVGPLPAEVQRTTVFSAGIAAKAENPDAARAFIQFLASPGSADAIRKSGLEPLARQASAEENLKRRNITLPAAATPAGNYVRAVRVGNLLFLSSSGPAQDKARGKVGKDVSREEAYQAARTTGLNLLAATRAELGSLDQVRRVVKVAGFVNAAPGFTELPQVLNGFSDLMVEVFGESIGKHARSVVGVAELPNNLPVSVEMILEIR